MQSWLDLAYRSLDCSLSDETKIWYLESLPWGKWQEEILAICKASMAEWRHHEARVSFPRPDGGRGASCPRAWSGASFGSTGVPPFPASIWVVNVVKLLDSWTMRLASWVMHELIPLVFVMFINCTNQLNAIIIKQLLVVNVCAVLYVQTMLKILSKQS